MKLSLIIPCFNEAENILPCAQAIEHTFASTGYGYEMILVDDGSKDGTLHELHKLVESSCQNIKVISFTRNFGKEAALYAGLKHAVGDYIAFMDADLQQRPEIVRDMVSYLDEHPECDVAAACQEERREGVLLGALKNLFYRVMNRMSDVELQQNASDFRTFRRSVAESILSLNEYHRFTKGIFSWIGYSTYYFPYQACQREHGTTKWSFRSLMRYAMQGIIVFSTAPLRLVNWFGFLSGVCALLYLIAAVVKKLTVGTEVSGYPTLIVLILFFSSVQLFSIGIIGEYVGRIFEQSKERPIYLVKEIFTSPDTQEIPQSEANVQ